MQFHILRLSSDRNKKKMKWHAETCTDPPAFPKLLCVVLNVFFLCFIHQLCKQQAALCWLVQWCNYKCPKPLTSNKNLISETKNSPLKQHVITILSFLNWGSTIYFCLDLKLWKWRGKNEKERKTNWIMKEQYNIFNHIGNITKLLTKDYSLTH